MTYGIFVAHREDSSNEPILSKLLPLFDVNPLVRSRFAHRPAFSLDAIDQAIDRGEQFEHNLEQGHRIQTEVDHRMMFVSVILHNHSTQPYKCLAEW